MNTFFFFIFLSSFAITSCSQQEEKHDLEKMTEETDASYKKMQNESEALQNRVKNLNKKIKIESRQRVEGIHKKLREETH